MFRISRYLQLLADPEALARAAAAPPAKPSGPVVIWNLIRRCNLTCRHCYSTSADKDFAGELSTDEVYGVMEDLRAFRVPVLILSGGEPLMRPDIFDLAHKAKALGFYVALSTNGTLIDQALLPRIREARFDYLGISLDGLEATHDRFRRRDGAFRESLQGLRLCRDAGIRVGIRFTLTRDNAEDLPGLLDLMAAEGIDKFYLSHLNYAGRGNTNRGDDAHFRLTREAMDLLLDTCWGRIQAGVPWSWSPATTTPTPSTCSIGRGGATQSGSQLWPPCCGDGAATPPGSMSPTSTIWVRSTPIPSGGPMAWAMCATAPSRRSGRTAPTP